jgi:hypothetical protein
MYNCCHEAEQKKETLIEEVVRFIKMNTAAQQQQQRISRELAAAKFSDSVFRETHSTHRSSHFHGSVWKKRPWLPAEGV